MSEGNDVELVDVELDKPKARKSLGRAKANSFDIKRTQEKPPNMEETASCLSRVAFWWLNSLLKLGSERPLNMDDVPEVCAKDEANLSYERFEQEWRREDLESLASIPPSERKVGPIFRTSRRFVGFAVLKASFFYVCFAVLGFAPPLILKLLVSYLEGTATYPIHVVWGFVFATLLLPPAASTFASQHNAIMGRAGVQLRTAYSLHIFRKALKLSSASRQGKDSGEIVNILSNDANKPVRFFFVLNALWVAPLQIGASLYLIGQEIGVSMWFAFIVLICLVPVNIVVFKKIQGYRIGILKASDARVKLMNEIISGIKIIKLYCWDTSFANKAQEIRLVEIAVLKKLVYLVGIAFSVILLSVPTMLPVVVFAAANSVFKISITASKAFTVISLFNILRFPFAFLPMAAVQWVTTMVAMKRIQNFLLMPELDDSKRAPPADPKTHAIHVTDGNFKWESLPAEPESMKGRRRKPKKSPDAKVVDSAATSAAAPVDSMTLKDINISIPHGQLVAVVGSVGCGKSSFMSALLGDITTVSGSAGMVGTVAYAAQQPWIMNCTLRENITFGLEHDTERFEEALRVRTIPLLCYPFSPHVPLVLKYRSVQWKLIFKSLKVEWKLKLGNVVSI